MTATDVWIFVRTDCPISNRYAPTIARLRQEFAAVKFQLVYPEPGATQESIDKHKREYGLSAIPSMLDSDLQRVRKFRIRVTPEAVVLADDGSLRYRGRIDDRQQNLKIARTPQKQDLRDAIRRPPARLLETRAIGCAIEGLR